MRRKRKKGIGEKRRERIAATIKPLVIITNENNTETSLKILRLYASYHAVHQQTRRREGKHARIFFKKRKRMRSIKLCWVLNGTQFCRKRRTRGKRIRSSRRRERRLAMARQNIKTGIRSINK